MSVIEKLERKEKLTTGERWNLLETIYDDATKYEGGMYVHTHIFFCCIQFS